MVNEKLHVGIVQTLLDYEKAWGNKGSTWRDSVKISKGEEQIAMRQIRGFMSALKNQSVRPDIVLLPELSVPIGFENQLRRIADKLGIIIIAGMDYVIDDSSVDPCVSNEAIIIVPAVLNGRRLAKQTELRRVGKTYPAKEELKKLEEVGVGFKSNPTIWLFEDALLGSFGVAVCYDFLDLDRIVLYRDRIQTLFILAYNRDITSFDHVAEAISRMAFCNVVVCNCGYYGGSVAISPFKEPHLRTVYRNSGNKLSNLQIVELPLRDLLNHQYSDTDKKFKSLPPGYKVKEVLDVKADFI
jgi:hypothetical protein